MQHQSASLADPRAAHESPSLVDGDSLIDLSDVTFALDGNTAVLTGTVANQNDRRTILLSLELVPGIDSIVDLLRLRE